MELKKIYLNAKQSKMNTKEKNSTNAGWLWNWRMKQFLKKMPIIQIGVGGSTASGKTYLIESMLRFFAEDNNDKPFYMTDSFKQNNRILSRDDRKKGLLRFFENMYADAYSRHRTLITNVNTYWVDGNATKQNRSFHGNTYFTVVKSGKKYCILLFRNIAGEIFETYYANRAMKQGDAKSLYTIFSEFLDKTEYNTKYGKDNEYKYLFKMNHSSFGKENIKQYIVNKFIKEDGEEKLKNDFVAYIKNEADIPDENNIKDYFNEFLFFYTSDVKIACMRCVKERTDRDRAESLINQAIRGLTYGNVLICITQFDKILKKKKLPKELIEDKNNKLHSLLHSWNYLYAKNDGQPLLFDYVEKTVWETENQFGDISNNYYLTSVSFHKTENCFYDFPDKNVTTTTTAKQWTESNKSHHTPIGVFELVHRILANSGFELQNTGDLYNKNGNNDHEYPEILARLGQI